MTRATRCIGLALLAGCASTTCEVRWQRGVDYGVARYDTAGRLVYRDGTTPLRTDSVDFGSYRLVQRFAYDDRGHLVQATVDGTPSRGIAVEGRFAQPAHMTVEQRWDGDRVVSFRQRLDAGDGRWREHTWTLHRLEGGAAHIVDATDGRGADREERRFSLVLDDRDRVVEAALTGQPRRRFVRDDAGRVTEILACPPGGDRDCRPVETRVFEGGRLREIRDARGTPRARLEWTGDQLQAIARPGGERTRWMWRGDRLVAEGSEEGWLRQLHWRGDRVVRVREAAGETRYEYGGACTGVPLPFPSAPTPPDPLAALRPPTVPTHHAPELPRFDAAADDFVPPL